MHPPHHNSYAMFILTQSKATHYVPICHGNAKSTNGITNTNKFFVPSTGNRSNQICGSRSRFPKHGECDIYSMLYVYVYIILRALEQALYRWIFDISIFLLVFQLNKIESECRCALIWRSEITACFRMVGISATILNGSLWIYRKRFNCDYPPRHVTYDESRTFRSMIQLLRISIKVRVSSNARAYQTWRTRRTRRTT